MVAPPAMGHEQQRRAHAVSDTLLTKSRRPAGYPDFAERSKSSKLLLHLPLRDALRQVSCIMFKRIERQHVPAGHVIAWPAVRDHRNVPTQTFAMDAILDV